MIFKYIKWNCVRKWQWFEFFLSRLVYKYEKQLIFDIFVSLTAYIVKGHKSIFPDKLLIVFYIFCLLFLYFFLIGAKSIVIVHKDWFIDYDAPLMLFRWSIITDHQLVSSNDRALDYDVELSIVNQNYLYK